MESKTIEIKKRTCFYTDDIMKVEDVNVFIRRKIIQNYSSLF